MDPEYKKFVQMVIDNVKKNGFPDKKVSFPIESLWAAAEKKELNFNKVLEILNGIQIAHTKTPEKIIFYPKDREPDAPNKTQTPNPMDMFGSLDPSSLKGMNPTQMIAAASKMMQNMDPAQLESAKKMVENMSDEDRAALMEQAKKMGFF